MNRKEKYILSCYSIVFAPKIFAILLIVIKQEVI